MREGGENMEDETRDNASTHAKCCGPETSHRKLTIASPATTTAQDMLRIWNEETKRNDGMTPHTARYLVACHKVKFRQSLDEWRSYLRKIRTSSYIMSPEFKSKIRSFLKWVISFRVIDCVLRGGFGCKFREESEKRPEEISKQIGELNESRR
jgi:hypothetical protein